MQIRKLNGAHEVRRSQKLRGLWTVVHTGSEFSFSLLPRNSLLEDSGLSRKQRSPANSVAMIMALRWPEVFPSGGLSSCDSLGLGV